MLDLTAPIPLQTLSSHQQNPLSSPPLSRKSPF